MGWGAMKSEATSLQLVLRVVRELRGGLELLGRVTGELQAGGATVLGPTGTARPRNYL